MRARGLIVVVAFLLAMSATLVVYLYLKGVEERTTGGGELVSVIVSETDIPAGTQLDELIAQGNFTSERVPENALIKGAVTNLGDLKGRETSAAIVAGEQITTGRLRGSEQLPGGALGIPDGHQAVTLPLELPRHVAGAIHIGDNVTIYGTFSDTKSTVVLVPTVEVLKVSIPEAAGNNVEAMLTMSLQPKDAQKVVLTQELGSIWLSLLPPNQNGKSGRPINALQLSTR
ncbi:MAG: Flp pilus assembly protein CpaB [Actinomycetota bacterium]